MADSSSLISLLMNRAVGLRRYVEAKIPTRLKRVVSADDVLQDVWVTVVRDAADITSSGSNDFDPWLTRVAQRRIADAIRGAAALKRGGRATFLRDRQKASSYVDLFARVRGTDPTPSKDASTREATDAVQVALSMLPDSHRAVVSMRYLEGRSHQDIADELGMTRSAVNSVLFRGMQKLKKLLGPSHRFLSGSHTYASSTSRSNAQAHSSDRALP